MTELYLQRNGTHIWTRVYIDTGQGFKLTKENPYFAQAESYTLDIALPMDILENRSFFQNLQRPDCSKDKTDYQCRLLVDSRPVLYGKAKVIQVTEKQVKVQLLGGRSEVNFMSDDNGEYVDELPLGNILDTEVRFATSEVNNETDERGGGGSVHFCLVDVARQILSYYGFAVTECTIDVEPWNKLYVATAKMTTEVAHTLPHWTAREFFSEFCNFFNVTLDIDELRRTVAIVGNPVFFKNRPVMQIEPLAEYTADMGNDGHALAADNLSFDLSSSAGHDYDCVADDMRQFVATEEYASQAAAEAAYKALSESARKRKIFKCPTGKFTGWDHDYSDWGEEQPVTLFTQIDMLAPLVRASDASETQLKICPVAIVMKESHYGFGDIWETNFTSRMFVPSLENPTGHDRTSVFDLSRRLGGDLASQQAEEEEGSSIQDLIEGNAEIDSQAEKEDRLQVMFIDDVPQTYSVENATAASSSYEERTHLVGFIDWQYKKSHRGNQHRRWSLSLCATDADHYLGELHRNGFSFNMKAKYCFKFLADRMPDPRCVYIIRNKRYGCEKIETNVNSDSFEKLMTGYFYEML